MRCCMMLQKGDKGDKGDNAFVVWQSQAGNEGKTEQDYFDFLQEASKRSYSTGIGNGRVR